MTQWGSLDDAPGVESLAVVAQRAWEACEELADKWRGGFVVAVTRDAAIRALTFGKLGGSWSTASESHPVAILIA